MDDENLRAMPGNKRKLQLRKVREGGFTDAKRQIYLDTLAGCATVCRSAAAAAAAGVSVETVNYHRRSHVLGDHSERGLSPEGWAQKVVAVAEAWGADLVVVEKNQGGDMTTSVLKTADPALPLRPVHARFGKGDRAEPVAMLFETGKARFAGTFPELEDELCAMVRGGAWAGPGRSPARADAMVWAMTELMLATRKAEPRIRQL